MTFAQPFSDYEILARVGSGAMGTVFKARQKKLERIVALKVLKPSLARDKRYVDRLRREAHIVASFNHENIVQGFDLGEEGGYHFFVMEFVEGRSLRELLQEWGAFPEGRVLDVAIKVASALDHAYRKGVIHRDIKPGNILIDNDGRVKLTDMGLAKGPTDLTITRDGATVGTPQYISPEQARDPQDVDVRSDLYSLGATLFHMVTGQPPFRAETMAKIILKLLQEPVPVPRELNPEVGEGLDLVIRKLLAKDPALRYQTPGDLLEDLRRVQRDEAPTVDPKELELANRALQGGAGPRKVWFYAVGAVAVIVLIVAGAFSVAGNGNGDPHNGNDEAAAQDRYRSGLSEALAGATSWPEKFRVVTTREATTNDWQGKILQRARAKLERDLGVDLGGLLEKQKAEARAWVQRQNDWRDLKKRYVDEELPRAIFDGLGMRIAVLPASVRGRIESHRVGLETVVGEQVAQLTEGYLAFHRSHLQGLPRKYRKPLELDNFVEARRVLREELDAFRRREDLPSVDRLPTSLRDQVAADEKTSRTTALAEIEAREKMAVADSGRCLGREQNIRKLLGKALGRTLDPQPAQTALEALERELSATWPEGHFSAERNPWPSARQVLARLRLDIQRQKLAFEAEQLHDYLAWVYRSEVLGGKAGKAAAFLSEVPSLSDSKLAHRHVRLLHAAEFVRGELLSKCLGTETQRTVRVRLRKSSDPQPVKLKVGRDRVAMTCRGKSVDLPQVALAQLEKQAAKAGFDRQALTEEQRAGLALWYWLGGNSSAVNSLLPKGELFKFITTVGTEIIDRLPQELPGPEDRRLADLQEIMRLHRQAKWAEMRKSIEAFRSEHVDLANKKAGDLRRFESAADMALHLDDLRNRAAAGVLLDFDAKAGLLTVQHDLSKSPADLPKGWKRLTDGLGATGHADLKNALASTLRFPTLLGAGCDQVDAHLRVRFPSEAGAARALVVFCHGVHVAVGLLQDGRACAVVLRPGDVNRPEAVRNACQRELSRLLRDKQTLKLQPLVSYDFRLRVEHSGRRLKIRLSIDGHELVSGTISGPPKILPELHVIPLHALDLCGVEFSGRPAQS